jgi:hypothetical protein
MIISVKKDITCRNCAGSSLTKASLDGSTISEPRGITKTVSNPLSFALKSS